MAANLILGGGRLLAVYAPTTSTTYTLTAAATPALTLDGQIDTQVTKDESGLMTITVNQVDDSSTLQTFIDTYAPASTGGVPEDITYEDGTLAKGANQTRLIVIVKGGTGTDGKVKSLNGVFTVAKSSGSWQQQGNTYNKPTLVFNGYPADYDIVIPSALLASFATTATTHTIAKTTHKYGKIFYE